MGLLRGMTDGDTIIVMNVLPLTFEGTKTRVNTYSQTYKQVRCLPLLLSTRKSISSGTHNKRLKNVVGCCHQVMLHLSRGFVSCQGMKIPGEFGLSKCMGQ
ncbi:unnamed protein product [Musa acuminata subsp. burmannicoides]